MPVRSHGLERPCHSPGLISVLGDLAAYWLGFPAAGVLAADVRSCLTVNTMLGQILPAQNYSLHQVKGSWLQGREGL